jgi:Cu(I)/Ag(I) efflux system membrane fusion protein
VLLVPAEAVIRTEKRNVVIVAQGEGRYAPVEVELGRESGDSVEIRKGLEPGTKIVASGQFMIDSEASLKGVLGRMTSGAEAAPPADPHAGHAMPAAAGAVVHEAQGVVRAVGDEVLIKHGAIPSAGMGAMTMPFKAPPSGVPPTVKEGTSVRFRFVFTPTGDLALTDLVPADGAAAAGADPGTKQ